MTAYVAPKIIILAHSLGGMVARTSVVLSNHPMEISKAEIVDENGVGSTAAGHTDIDTDSIHCRVSDIIMLSSPNNR